MNIFDILKEINLSIKISLFVLLVSLIIYYIDFKLNSFKNSNSYNKMLKYRIIKNSLLNC